MRKIIQITTCVSNLMKQVSLVVLCDDGTTWELSDEKKWCVLPNIPQDNIKNYCNLCGGNHKHYGARQQ